MENLVNKTFWNGKRVFLTGHTGFKGAWLCRVLVGAGARLTGYALAPLPGQPLFELAGVEGDMASVIGDVRDADALRAAYEQAAPEIVIHMAAQPLVRESYANPAYTYEVNVMGTVNLLECVRTLPGAVSVLNVTTDKVYNNNEWVWGYRETDPLDGFDPYSNSKSCSELVTHSYRRSFFEDGKVALSTARAGNVIGGGDFSKDRIIPDCVRAVQKGEAITVRNPGSVRPYQHVLEPLFAYLMIAEAQYKNPALAGWYNVGPNDSDCLTTSRLVELFCEEWGAGASWKGQGENGPHEAGLLKLDCASIKSTFGWRPRLDAAGAIRRTVEWSRAWLAGEDTAAVMDRQIQEFWGEEHV